MKNINIRQIEAFRAVLTLGSMSKAAALLGISQPAISRLIADFQQVVGFVLFNRKRYSAEPTADARLLFEKVDKFFLGLEGLTKEILDIQVANSGKIVISATSSYANGVLPYAIAVFNKDYENISISLNIQSHEEVVDWVASGRADVGFVIQPVAHSSLNLYQFLTGTSQCILSANHPLAKKQALVPEDLAQIPYVSFARGTPLRFEIDNFFNHLGIERILHVEATSHHAVCALVSAGLGVALVNPFAPIDGYHDPIVARPISPSIEIGLKMLTNDSQPSVCAGKFRASFLDTVSRELGLPRSARNDDTSSHHRTLV
jgi:DNA-binding transcriptional LysR family regulator